MFYVRKKEGEPMSEKNITDIYKKLWNERTIDPPSVESLIQIELLDEQTHPRLRKSKYEKFFYAIKRILQSNLDDDEKLVLIQIYSKQLDKLNE